MSSVFGEPELISTAAHTLMSELARAEQCRKGCGTAVLNHSRCFGAAKRTCPQVYAKAQQEGQSQMQMQVFEVERLGVITSRTSAEHLASVVGQAGMVPASESSAEL